MPGWNSSLMKHHHFRRDNNVADPNRNKVYQHILETVGNTPLVKLNVIPKKYGIECEVYAKCEFFNPGGSIKDRVGVSMMKDAVAHGAVHDNTIFVEATSGNTGIAVAFNASLRGNKSTIVTSVKNSDEKVDTMRLIGANVIQIKTTQSATKIAQKIKDADPDHMVMLNQYDNDVNPRTHYEITAEEIISALGTVDMAVMGAGTGGTFSGIGHRLKELNPKCLIVAAEPDGSTMFNKKGKSHPFLVEGIGGSFIPMTLDVTLADCFEVATDEEAFLMARELSKKEGLLCGGSSGVAMVAALKAAKNLNLKAGQRVVVILPDGIRNYMTKFVSDQWMEAYRFKEPPQHTMKWWKTPITELKTPDYPVVGKTHTCAEALDAMSAASTDLALVEDDQGNYVGVAYKDGFRNYATNPAKMPGYNSEEFDFSSPVTEYLVKHAFTLALNSKKGMPTIGLVSRVLDITPFVVIGNEAAVQPGKCCGCIYSEHFKAKGVATGDDILDYIRRSSS